MTTTYAILIASAIGHGLHTILLVNVAHGQGVNARWIDRHVFAVLGLIGLAAIASAWLLSGTPWTGWPLPARAYSLACLATLFLGLPIATASRAMRRPPSEVKRLRSTEINLASRCGPDALIGLAGRSFLLRIPFNDAFRLHLSEWAVTIDGLPESLDGLTVLHLTDLHFAPAYSRRFFDEVVESAIGAGPEPDLVAVTGDFLDHDDMTGWVVPVLSRLRGRLGQFAILGNHDYRHDFRGLRRELRAAGFTTLEGRWTVLDADGSRLAIGGTSYPWGKDLLRREVPSAEARIVLSHAPDQVYRMAARGADLMLCGHNHGGQVRLPAIGPVLVPSRYSRRFDRGFFRVGPTLMYVGQGVGAKDPIRIGCVPEVTRLVLRSPASALDPGDGRRDEAMIQLARP